MSPDEFRRWRYPWHWAVNKYHDGKHGSDRAAFMYEAMHAAEEHMRLPLLFKAERMRALEDSHRQCSHSQAEPVQDNHLSCCLGVQCRECPHLVALDSADLTDEQRDEAKAFTCIAHILSEGGDTAGEGYILTVDDRMYWDRVYENLAADLA